MPLPRFFLIATLCSSVALAQPAGSVVAWVPNGATLTGDELLAEIQRLPPAAQAQAMARPAELARAAQNLLLRRELARQAEAEGLASDPRVAAALQSARERVLAEARLEAAEGQPPDPAALERLALNQYNATPERFEMPEQVRVQHILVDRRSCEPEAKARELLAAARAPGADFAALAKANSHDPASAARGGDVGFFSRGRMAAPFEAAAFALKEPGDISDIVKTDFGFHIIRLEERKPAGTRPFEAVRDELMKNLAEAETRTRRRQYVDGINESVAFAPGVIEGLVAAQKASAKAK